MTTWRSRLHFADPWADNRDEDHCHICERGAHEVNLDRDAPDPDRRNVVLHICEGCAEARDEERDGE